MRDLYLVGMGVMVCINLIFFVLFEREKPKPKDILPMVVICCGASLGRVIFSVIPQVQPVTALVIIVGSVWGCKRGYITGALCALFSNLFLGQGPWTLYQMTGWGSVGFVAGLLGKITRRWKPDFKKLFFAIYGFIAAMQFSLITDFLTISYLGENATLEGMLAVWTTGIIFNMGHGWTNVVFLLFLYKEISKKI